jgi:integrase
MCRAIVSAHYAIDSVAPCPSSLQLGNAFLPTLQVAPLHKLESAAASLTRRSSRRYCAIPTRGDWPRWACSLDTFGATAPAFGIGKISLASLSTNPCARLHPRAREADAGLNATGTRRRNRITLRPLRNTFASWLAIACLPLRWIQELLGHKSILTTERYSHLGAEGVKPYYVELVH